MIWHRGAIIPDDALQISVLDRAFEHGLGLFETLRTWNGQPALLGRHLERLQRSAQELALPFDRTHLPDAQAVLDLIAASRASLPPDQDVRVRITLSGGRSTATSPEGTLWMTVGPLPAPLRESRAVITQTVQITSDDVLARHKTLNYWRKRIAQSQAAANGSDDVLFLTPAGHICETSRANIFLVKDRRLLTPSLAEPLLPGVMRALVIERAAAIGLAIDQAPLLVERIHDADEVFVTSSLRGILPVARLLDRDLPTAGPVTHLLWSDLLPWLESTGKR